MVDLTSTPCWSIDGQHDWYNFGNAYCDEQRHNLHRDCNQHWRKCNHNGHHPHQRCSSVRNYIQPKFVHAHQRCCNDNGYSILKRWKRNLLVDFTSTPGRTVVLNLERVNLWNTNSGLILGKLHNYCNERWRQWYGNRDHSS